MGGCGLCVVSYSSGVIPGQTLRRGGAGEAEGGGPSVSSSLLIDVFMNEAL